MESQATHADLVKDVHELWQFVIVKLASCTSNLDSLDCDVRNYCAEATQTSTNLEALEKCLAMTEDALVKVGLWEIRTKLQKMNEELATIRG